MAAHQYVYRLTVTGDVWHGYGPYQSDELALGSATAGAEKDYKTPEKNFMFKITELGRVTEPSGEVTSLKVFTAK